jgi:inhibitor of cysteine peptidase
LNYVCHTFLLTGCLMLASCAPVNTQADAAPAPNPNPRTVRVSSRDAGQKVDLKTGDSLQVELASNPSTGYRWERSPLPEVGVLENVGTEQRPSNTGLLGSGGTVVFTFRAIGTGLSNLSFTLVSPARQREQTITYFISVY